MDTYISDPNFEASIRQDLAQKYEEGRREEVGNILAEQTTSLYSQFNLTNATLGNEAKQEVRNDFMSSLSIEIEFALKDVSIPSDEVDEVRETLIERFPSDSNYEAAVDNAIENLEAVWESQGRSHEVLDPLFEAAGKGNVSEYEEVVTAQLTGVANGIPRQQAVEDFVSVLEDYGPQGADYINALHSVQEDLFETRPLEAAEEIEQAYEDGGAVAASEKLRELTDPLEVNPLTAGLIFNESKPTIDKMVTYLGDSIRINDVQEVFSNLSAATDSA